MDADICLRSVSDAIDCLKQSSENKSLIKTYQFFYKKFIALKVNSRSSKPINLSLSEKNEEKEKRIELRVERGITSF